MVNSISDTYKGNQIGSDHRKYKDYRDIFSMACAEVTTSDKLFQIITRRLDDGASAGVQVGQFKRKCVACAVMTSTRSDN